MEEVQRIPLHDERIRIAPARRISTGEHVPDTRFDGAAAESALCAGGGIRCVTAMKQILSGKDIRMNSIPLCPPIGGKLGEKVIVVFFFFRACEEIVKEIIGARVVPPEYREIVLHRAVLSLRMS